VDEAARQCHRGIGVDGDKELPLLGRHLPEFDWALPIIAADRRLADPGIVDKDLDYPEALSCLDDDLVDRLVASKISLDRQQICCFLPLLYGLGELGKTFRGAVDCRDFDFFVKQAQHKRASDAAGRARHDRDALLFAHSLLSWLCAKTLRHAPMQRKVFERFAGMDGAETRLRGTSVLESHGGITNVAVILTRRKATARWGL